jgi:hypothetical protein
MQIFIIKHFMFKAGMNGEITFLGSCKYQEGFLFVFHCIFFYCCAERGYIVAFTKVLTIRVTFK